MHIQRIIKIFIVLAIAALFIGYMLVMAHDKRVMQESMNKITLFRITGALSTGMEYKDIYVEDTDYFRIIEIDNKYKASHDGDEDYLNKGHIYHYYTDEELEAVSLDEISDDYKELIELLQIDKLKQKEGYVWDSDYTSHIKLFRAVKEYMKSE